VRGGVGSGAQGGTLALRRHCLVDCHLYILGMMAWLSNGYSKRKLSKVQRLACLGITGAIRATPTGAMSPSTGSGDTGGGEVGGSSPLESGVLVLTSPPTRT
jgi:hypothetical protein